MRGDETAQQGAEPPIASLLPGHAMPAERPADRPLFAMLDRIAQPLVVADDAAGILFANTAALHALGYRAAHELRSGSGRARLRPAAPGTFAGLLQPCVTGRPARGEDEWIARRDGSLIPVEYWSAAIDIGDGRGVIVAFADIAQRRQAEQVRAAEVAANDMRQRAILDAALDSVISMDELGRITYFNAAAERTFGHSAEEVLGRDLADVIVPPALRAAHRAGLARYLAEGAPRVLDRRIELPAVRADGGEFPVELTVTRVNLSGAPLFTAYLRDITDRREAQAALGATRRRLRSVANEQAALRRVATLVAGQAAPDDVLAAVAEEVANVLDVPLTSIIRYDGELATQVGVWGTLIPYEVGTSWPLDAHGVSGRIWRSRRPERVDYSDVDGPIAQTLAGDGVRFAVGVPIVVGGSLWGAMMALSTQRSGLPPGIEDRLASFTELVGTAIANAQARDELSKLVDEQSALRRVATLVAQRAAPADVFDAVCEETGRLLDATIVNLAHFTPDGENLTMAGWSIGGTHVPQGTRLPLEGETINSIIRRTGAPARVDSYAGVQGELAAMLRRLGTRSEVGAPVVVDGSVWGALIAGTRHEQPLAADFEPRLAGFTELVATAISNTAARAELLGAQRRVIEAADAERRRLTRDIHDGAQQQFVNTLINVQLAQQKCACDPERAAALLDRAARAAVAGIEELRELAAGIHPALLSDRGLAAALDALAARMPMPVKLEIAALELPQPVEASVYFFCSEALTNVIKHAQATCAAITIAADGDVLGVTVEDDGIGGARLGADGSGLRGLKDRVAALEGTLEIHSPGSGSGTTVCARIPLGA